MQELLAKLDELVKQEFNKEVITTGKQWVEDLDQHYAQERDRAREEFLNDAENEAGDFEHRPDESERQFLELKTKFHDKRKAFAEMRAQQEKENLQKKQHIIDQITAIPREEENIGKAFSVFKELQESWKEIGRVPGDKHKDIQNAYMAAVDSFYYHINIYRDLKVFDLKKNLEAKQEIVSKLEVLAKADAENLEENVKNLQQEWYEIGPVPKEDFDVLKAQFTAALDKGYEIIKDKRQKRKEQLLANLDVKKELLAKAQQLAENIPTSAKAWNKATDAIKELQQTWKNTGFGPRKDNEEIWKEFRAACDAFFEAKSDFYKDFKKELALNQTQKEELCDQAEVLKLSTDWRETTKKMIDLQKKWKKIGPAPQSQEQKLWKRFRGACDAFFEAKEQHHKQVEKDFEENLKQKQELITELEAFNLPSEKSEAVAVLKKFYNRWTGLGKVPKDHIKAVNEGFQKAFDAKMEAAGLDKNELEHSKFTARVTALLQEEDFKKALAKERKFIQDKIEDFKKQAIQYENNLGFFGNAKNSNNPLLEEAKKKINTTNKAIDRMKEQVDYINKSIRKKERELAAASEEKTEAASEKESA